MNVRMLSANAVFLMLPALLAACSDAPRPPAAIRTRKSSGVISSSPKHTALTVAATKRYIFIAVVATA